MDSSSPSLDSLLLSTPQVRRQSPVLIDLNKPLQFNSSQQLRDFLMFPFNPTTPEDQDQDNEERAVFSGFFGVPKEAMNLFWRQQMVDIQNTSAFKNNSHLPFARIRRIMKKNHDVKMISADTPVLFSKACELIILELTLRAWLHTEGCNRRTLQRSDIAMAIRNSDSMHHHLLDLVPIDHQDDEAVGDPDQELGTPFATQMANPPMIVPGLEGNNNELLQTLMPGPPISSIGFNLEPAPK